MSINIPKTPFDPPNWFSGTPGCNFNLDDMRWLGAVKRTFGSGGSDDASFRALYYTDINGNNYLCLTFRVKFAMGLSADDSVFVGLQKHGSTDAMVIKMSPYGTSHLSAGPPSSTLPSNLSAIFMWTLSAGVWSLQSQLPSTSPQWINQNARVWAQNKGPFPPDDPNCSRWAIQLRIPVTSTGRIFDNSGPNLGTDFDMWYFIGGGFVNNDFVIYGENRTSGNTLMYDLTHHNFPVPSLWDESLLATGPGASGGVALYGNGYNDIAVINTVTNVEGDEIANGRDVNGQLNNHTNTFIIRPRNYRPQNDPVTGLVNTILSGHINATIRIANFGSAPSVANFATAGTWDYVPGNSATVPVPSCEDIPFLPPGNNPLSAIRPIRLENVTLIPPAGSVRHQCILVTLSSNDNITFLTDSAYRNMNYDHASLLELDAEISVVGLTPISTQPRNVCLAVEKINMPRTTPPGTDEGRFLESSMNRLISQGGLLAEKLINVRSHLKDAGDFGSDEGLKSLLVALKQSLAKLEAQSGRNTEVTQLISALGKWLTIAKKNESSADRLSQLFDALSSWLSVTDRTAKSTLQSFISQLNLWLMSLGMDPGSSKYATVVAQALHAWLLKVVAGKKLAEPAGALEEWLASSRSAETLAPILNLLAKTLASLSSATSLRGVVERFAITASRWLKGHERLDVFVRILSEAGLGEEEIEQLFPTIRIHVYHDTGERFTGSDGLTHTVWRVQSSFGVHVYHEGRLDGWQTSLQGAQRVDSNLYTLAVPNNGSSKIKMRVQGVKPEEKRIPEDRILKPRLRPR
jgi:hypothetical protein